MNILKAKVKDIHICEARWEDQSVDELWQAVAACRQCIQRSDELLAQFYGQEEPDVDPVQVRRYLAPAA